MRDPALMSMDCKNEGHPGNFEPQGGVMNNRKLRLLSVAVLFTFLVSGNAWANKAEAKIEAPESAAKGTEITVRVTAIHNADGYFHHVEWLWIQVNGIEIARWDYTASNRPEGAAFTKEVK
jgi:desulfoferrodoxin (superoxide reductase-like protein)